MFSKKTETIKLPNPIVPTWYWLERNEKWKPVLVNPATKSWPATINDVHQTTVDKVRGNWGDFIPYPSTNNAGE